MSRLRVLRNRIRLAMKTQLAAIRQLERALSLAPSPALEVTRAHLSEGYRQLQKKLTDVDREIAAVEEEQPHA